MDSPTIYLIANNMSPSKGLTEYITNLKLSDDDIIVTFNQANSPIVKLFPRIDIACFRYGSGVKSNYFGVMNNLMIKPVQAKADKFFFMNDPSGNNTPPIIKKNGIQDRYEVHTDIKKLEYGEIKYNCGKGRAPTTGVFYLFHFLNNYPEYNIELIGFNLFDGRRDNLHPFSWERKIIRIIDQLDRVKLII